MKLVHLSDIHAGKKLGALSLREDLMACMEQVARTCKERGVDVIVVSGDLYDSTTPSAAAVSQVDDILRCLAGSGSLVVVSPGNHDSATRVGYLSSFLEEAGVVMVGDFDGTVRPVEIADEHGTVSIWPVPYLNPGDVRAAFGLEYEPGFTHDAALRLLVESLPVDTSSRNVAMTHQFFTCGSRDPELAGSEQTLGGSDAVSASVFDAFDYVAAGHVHLPQRIGRDTMRYSGSPLKYSKGEARGKKSFPLVTLGAKGDVSVELVPFEPIHDVRQVKGPLDMLVEVGKCDPNATDFIYATVTDEVPALDAQARLRSVYPNLVQYSVENSVTRAEGAEIDIDRIEGLSPFELFSEFYSKQTGLDLTASQSAYVAGKLESLEG